MESDNVLEPGDLYRHFKGNLYEIMGVAKHTENQETLVVYQAVGGGELWVRPESNFWEVVDNDGVLVRRFVKELKPNIYVAEEYAVQIIDRIAAALEHRTEEMKTCRFEDGSSGLPYHYQELTGAINRLTNGLSGMVLAGIANLKGRDEELSWE